MAFSRFWDSYTESPQVGIGVVGVASLRQRECQRQRNANVSAIFTSFFGVNTMHTTPVLEHLKKHGQLLDLEIAAATGIPLPKVRSSLSDLSARGEISRCRVIRYESGKPVEATLCRISGYVPKPAPGRKPGVKAA